MVRNSTRCLWAFAREFEEINFTSHSSRAQRATIISGSYSLCGNYNHARAPFDVLIYPIILFLLLLFCRLLLFFFFYLYHIQQGVIISTRLTISFDFRLRLSSWALLALSAVSSLELNNNNGPYETVRTSNAAILNRLGLVPLKIPDGHHKKRLAGPEPPGLQSRIHQSYSRRHGHRDSHVYIVKLPASQPYYTITKPHKSLTKEKLAKASDGKLPVGFSNNGKPGKIYHWNLPIVKKIGGDKKKLLPSHSRMDQVRKKLQDNEANNMRKNHKDTAASGQDQPVISSKLKEKLKDKISKKPDGQKQFPGMDNSVGHAKKTTALIGKHVRNNDKRLNAPIGEELRKLSSLGKNKSHQANKMSRLDDSTVYRLKGQPSEQLPNWHLSNGESTKSSNAAQKVKKHRKKAAMSYYAPIISKAGSTSIQKNFPGNGKPKALYVMEKSRKPIYYHSLLP